MATKRQRIYSKFDGLCAYTGKPLGDDWQIDHVNSNCSYEWKLIREGVSKSQRKDRMKENNSEDNLLPALRIVNFYKSSRGLEGFRKFMMSFHLRLAKLPKKTKIEKTKRRIEFLEKISLVFDIQIDKPFSGVFYFETLKGEDLEQENS
jgi:hypothetical protein